MTHTYDIALFSDLHKDAHGVRPSKYQFQLWSEMTPDQLQLEWDYMCRVLEQEEAREQAAHAEAIVAFEARVAETMAMGAVYREQAIRWIMDAEGVVITDGGVSDKEELEWTLGLPFGYLTNPEG